jgi:hypothetical protein
MKIKQFFITVVLLLGCSVYTLPAQALCVQSGVIVSAGTEIDGDDPSGETFNFVAALRNGATSNFLWVVVVPNEDSTRNLVTAMMMGQRQVEMVGSEETCPASGAIRQMGALIAVQSI